MPAPTNPILEAATKALTGMGIPAPDVVDRAPSQTLRNIPAGPGGISTAMKATGYLGIEDQPAGAALNPQAQLGLFHRIRKKAGWARYVSFKPVSEKTGYIDLWDDNSFKMLPTAKEGPRRNIPLNHPEITQKTFSTKTLSGAIGLRLSAIKAAQKAGQDVNALIQQGIAAGIGNVFLDIGLNGNTSLPKDGGVNEMRSTADGWLQKIRTLGSNYTSVEDGFSYHNGVWAGMLQQIDEAYRSDPGLAWGGPDVLGTRWLTELTAMGANAAPGAPSIINDLGAAILNSTVNGAKPLGKNFVVWPQLSSQGEGTEGYPGVAPTSVVNNGDGTLTININTLAGSGTDRSATGDDGQRHVKVMRVSTGVEETIAVDFSTPNNTVTTSSLLGQTLVSTTASDYYVRWADQTSLFLGLMRYLTMVIQNGIRIYTMFYPKDETLEIVIHADIDYVVIDYDAVSLVDSLIAPRFDILP